MTTQMSNLELAIEQAKLQDTLQDAANRYGWDSEQVLRLGGFEAFNASIEKHDSVFRKLSPVERRAYLNAL